MLRFLIKLPRNFNANDSSVLLYSNSVLSDFKAELQNSVNYNKIKVRYDYLISNNILQFSKNDLDYKRIIQLAIQSLKVTRIQTNNNLIRTCIILPNYLLIPNSNMTYFNFIKFIEYGNLEIPPYHWILSAWNKVKPKE